MLILGNLYQKNDILWVIVLSSTPLDGYTPFKKSTVVDNIVMYQYNIQISDENTTIKHNSKTYIIPNVKPELNNTSVYYVSCDGQNTKKYNFSNPIKVYNVNDDTDMWKKLYMDITADTNIHKYVIHLGDQVYMDDANDELITNKTENDTNVVRRTYYDAYKLNYDNEYKKNVLQSAYNIMIRDDHEIINDYGSIPNNLTPSMLVNLNDIYNIFQQDLYGVKEHNIKHLVFKDFQIIIPDLIKYRQLNTDNTTKYPIMGETQMIEFDNIVKNTQSKIKRTYYVSTIPLVGVNKLYKKTSYFFSGGRLNLEEKACYTVTPTRETEQKYILDKLFELDNNVTIICGDLHFAECITLVKNWKCIKQITTSPISSNVTLDFRNPFYEKIMAWLVNALVYDRFIGNIFIHKNWFMFDYNYLKMNNEHDAILRCYNDDNSKNITL